MGIDPLPPLIPEFIIYLVDEIYMFGIFTLAIKCDCLFLGIFSKFLLICDFYF